MTVDLTEELQLQLEKELCEVSPDTLIKLVVFFKLKQGKCRAKLTLA